MIESPQAFGLTPREVHDLVAAAGRAPAWPDERAPLLRLSRDVVEVRAAAPGREQRIAGGAALFTLRLALLGFGIRPLVTILPDRGDPALLARIRNGGRKRPTAEHRWLLKALAEDRAATGNSAGCGRSAACGGEPISRPEQAALRRAAVEEGCWLDVLLEGDQPCGALVAALTAQLDGQPADVRAGQAVQRVRLTAVAEGLAPTHLSDAVRLSRAHDELRRRFGRHRAPLAILRIARDRMGRVSAERLSCAEPSSSAPRRQLQGCRPPADRDTTARALLPQRGGPAAGGPAPTTAAADRHI